MYCRIKFCCYPLEWGNLCPQRTKRNLNTLRSFLLQNVYTLSDLRTALQNPDKFGREINRFCHTRGFRREHHPDAVDIFERDWDNLIILDACRYDVFKEVSEISGQLTAEYSKGCATYQFIRENFRSRRLYDTVYVGANTWYLKLKDEIGSDIHKFVDLQDPAKDVDFASEELRVVEPSTVTRFAKETDEQFPDKRLIVHYLQPHHPFIGPVGSNVYEHTSSSLYEVVTNTPEANRETLREAYQENLEIVLAEVEQLLDSLTGRTVVTSDHGEMLGERHRFVPMRDYGHHKYIFNEETIMVPWLVIDDGPRKSITEAETGLSESPDPDELEERLRHLGYKV